jgi:hypothetical protein
MPERINAMIFVDFPSTDPEAMSTFYADLFVWTFNRRPANEFHEVLPGVKPNLGIHRSDTAMSGPVPRHRRSAVGRQPVNSSAASGVATSLRTSCMT